MQYITHSVYGALHRPDQTGNTGRDPRRPRDHADPLEPVPGAQRDQPFASSPVFLAGLIAQRDLPFGEMLDRYELYIYKQWLRVYMRSEMIKHNKDLFESLDDTPALLNFLYIY
jgi:hypothetical protein